MYCFAGSDSSNIWKLVCFVLMKYNNKLNRSINLLFLPHYIQMIFYRSLILKKLQYFDAVFHKVNTKYINDQSLFLQLYIC